jgi:DNA-binding HxlR family transcriptional regulator
MARTYGHYCAIARTLELIGERWTLLVVRELLTGPKRFKDLRDGLPGVGTALLTERLRALEEAGLVRRSTLPPPAGVGVYELTDAGTELRPLVMEVARWGLRWALDDPADDVFRPSWAVLAMQAIFDPDAARGLRVACEFRVGDEIFHAAIEDGRIETAQGAASAPDLVVETDASTFRAVAAQELSLTDSVREGRANLRGNLAELRRVERSLRPPERIARAATAS